MFITINALIRVLSGVLVDITTKAALKWFLTSVFVYFATIAVIQYSLQCVQIFITINALISVLSSVFVDITTITALKWIPSGMFVNIATVFAM